jgi:hypothetical protein
MQEQNANLKKQVADMGAAVERLTKLCQLAGIAVEDGDSPGTLPATTQESQPQTKPAADKRVRVVTVDAYLSTVENTAQEYKKAYAVAKNAVERDDLSKPLVQKAEAGLKDILLTAEMEVKDIRMTDDEVAELSCNVKFKFSERKGTALGITVFPTLTIRMTREQAKAVKKGDRVIVRGIPIASDYSYGASAQPIVTLKVEGKTTPVTVVVMKSYTATIGGRTFDSPFSQK